MRHRDACALLVVTSTFLNRARAPRGEFRRARARTGKLENQVRGAIVRPVCASPQSSSTARARGPAVSDTAVEAEAKGLARGRGSVAVASIAAVQPPMSTPAPEPEPEPAGAKAEPTAASLEYVAVPAPAAEGGADLSSVSLLEGSTLIWVRKLSLAAAAACNPAPPRADAPFNRHTPALTSPAAAPASRLDASAGRIDRQRGAAGGGLALGFAAARAAARGLSQDGPRLADRGL